MLTYTQTFPNLPPFSLLQQATYAQEVLLEAKAISRTGTLDGAALELASSQAKAAGKRVVLVWDVLASDDDIATQAAFVRTLDLARVDAIRVQDAGVAEYVREHFPELKLQLVLETGNHNLQGIKAWIDHFKPERIALSNEIPIGTLAEWRPQIPCEIEVQVMGQLLLFFTPRKLLTPIEKERKQQELLQRFATNLEPGRSEGKVFPILENRHGTFMFYEKELFLLPYIEEIQAAGVDVARIDLKAHDADTLTPLIRAYLERSQAETLDAIKAHLGPKLTRGFFKSNRTDKQFAKFKNQHTFGAEEQEGFVGPVVDVKKKRYLLIETKGPLKVGDKLRIVTPEGANVELTINILSAPKGKAVQEAVTPGLWYVNHVPRVSSGSMVFFA